MRQVVTMSALGFLVACGNEMDGEGEERPLTDDVFWIEIVETTKGDPCKGDITHNYIGARPDGGSSLVFREEIETESPSGGYAYVTRRGDGELIMNLEGEVFVGSFTDGDTIDVSWSATDELTERVEFQEEYAFEGIETFTQDQTFAMARDGEMFVGTLTFTEGESLTFSESDQWNSGKVGINQTNIPTFSYLEPIKGPGFISNDDDDNDCTEDDCELWVTEDCMETFDVTAYPVEGGIDTFDALVGFERPAGVPQSNGFP